MTVEEAIVTSLEHEKKVRDHYAWAAGESGDPKGKAFFETLAKEEQGHVDYLESRLEKLRGSGALDSPPIGTVLPSAELVAKGARMIEASAQARDYRGDTSRLYTALRLEEEVSLFYRGLAEGLADPAAKAMFARFLEIEDGHTAIVQAEVDFVTRTGYFFDFQEFNLEE